MNTSNIKLLIVDDDESVRTSLSLIFLSIGYFVRSASDGFSALCEIEKELPGILLSDLNMPGMSGFELLSVARRRFSAVRVIAMSGAFSGERVPSGIVADAFHEKATPIARLLEQVATLARPDWVRTLDCPYPSAPIWFPRNGHNSSGAPFITISCPSCLRSFPEVVNEANAHIHEADCTHCGTRIPYAIVPPLNMGLTHAF